MSTKSVRSDRPAINEQEAQTRKALVDLTTAMLDGRVSFFEGAIEVLRLKSTAGGIADRDPDFDAFVAIASETDHLPLKAQQHLWSAEALDALQSEFERTEVWATSFAPAACCKLIERFSE